MERLHYPIFLFFFLFSCSQKEKSSTFEMPDLSSAIKKSTLAELQQLIDTANVKGTILIFDEKQDMYYSNDFDWAGKGQLPASTFKIANSIIALETGVVENDSTLFKWDGEDRWLDVWEQDLILKEAFHFSCVPCYQEVARKIGSNRMNEYLEKLNYGDIKVDSSNIDQFWLRGESKISPMQQIDFLKKFYHSELPISEKTEKIMKRMMVMSESDDYKLIGKTGWSTYQEKDNGWFVGYVEKKKKLYFFATNVEPNPSFDMDNFGKVRKSITFQALELLRIL